MHFESLKLFCDVVRFRSFSQAAAANKVTQSAASQIVLQIEKRLDVKLIDRSTRPWQLTREGQTYYEGCKELVERYLELEASMRSQPAQIAPSVQVAAIYSVGLGDMSEFVRRFSEQAPQVKVHVEYLHPDKVYERVQDGTADFGLVSFPRPTRELAATPWREEEMVLVCAPGHRLSKLRAVRLDQLEGENYVGFDRGLVIRREVDRFLREHGVTVSVVAEFDNIENIKKAIEIGAGVALLPLPTIGREIADGTLKAVSLGHHRFVRPLGIIHRRAQSVSAAAKKFIDLLRGVEGAAQRRDRSTAPSGAAGRSRPAGNGVQRGSGAKPRRSKRAI